MRAAQNEREGGLELLGIETRAPRHVGGSMLASKRLMTSDRRGSGSRLKYVLALALTLPLLSACAPVVGGGVLVVVVAIGALTTHCYDYIDVSVFDPQGRKTCAATVTATNGGDSFELKSCYYAPLTDGHWTLRASLPGFPDAVSTADVEHDNDCTRHVQSMELTINSPGARPAPSPAPVAPQLPPPPPEPAVSPSVSVPAAPASSAVPPAPPSSAVPPAPPSSAVPAASAPPSVGVFPDAAHPSPAK
jgi:hypothetical protein